MNQLTTLDAYAVVTEPATLTIQRLLPGPIERVWAYLTESDLRRRWMAAGEMEMKVGSTVDLVWRNDELSNPPGVRPAGFAEEHRMESRITELDPPHKLAITWGSTGGVSFELDRQGSDVLLTVTHHRVTDRSTLLMVSAGWHAHLDLLVADMNGRKTTSFWDGWTRLHAEYERRIAA